MISDYLLLILPKLHSFASSNLASCLHPTPSLRGSIEAQTKAQLYDPLEAFVIHVTRVSRFIYMLLCALMNVTLAAIVAASPSLNEISI